MVPHPRVKRHQTARGTHRFPEPVAVHALAVCCVFTSLLAICAWGQPHAADSKANVESHLTIEKQIESGDLKTAREASRQGWLRDQQSKSGWKFKIQYITVLIRQNDKAGAAELLRDTVPPAFHELNPRYEYLRGYLSRREKDAPAAIRYLAKAATLARTEHDAVTEGDALSLLASLQDDKKVELLNRALVIARTNRLENLEEGTLSNLGNAMHDLGRYSAGVSYLLQAVPIAERRKERYLEAAIQDNLGECYLSLGDLYEASESLNKAQSLVIESDPPSLRADINMGLGTVSSMRRENAEAVKEFTKAFSIVQKDSTLELYVPSAEKLAAALIEQHQLAEAERYNNLAYAALQREPNNYQLAWYELNQADIAAQRKQARQAEELYHKVLRMQVGELADARWSAFARLAELESEMGHLTEARTNFEDALSAIEDNRLKQTATKFQITFLSSLIRFYQRYVAFLVSVKRSADALAVADSSRASVLTQGLRSNRKNAHFISQVREQARLSNSALLFYWLAPGASYLWLIAPDGEDFRYVLPAEEQISAEVQNYSRAIQSAEDPLKSRAKLGSHLYQTLVAPAAGHLPAGTRIIVLPDGALHGLNFETLLVKSASSDAVHYWLDDVTLSIAPSLSILLDRKRSVPNSGRALIIGNASYAGDKYQPLPESGKEVADLTQLFGKANSTVKTQGEAIPDAYQKAHPESFSFIHFSAHVEANERTPLDSAIILSPGEYGNRQLYAHLIQDTPIHADLVTISGCNSAGKKVLAGEGMVGFAWAAFQAGANNALTSLWEVDDESTTNLMHNFYSEVMKGTAYDKALHEAKMRMRTKYKKPYYWAPFQLYSRNLNDNSHALAHSTY